MEIVRSGNKRWPSASTKAQRPDAIRRRLVDLAARILQAYSDSSNLECILPNCSMEPVTLDKRSVDVTKNCFHHLIFLSRVPITHEKGGKTLGPSPSQINLGNYFFLVFGGVGVVLRPGCAEAPTLSAVLP